MIAQTIANQLGSLCLGLLGAHTLVDIGDGLQFHIRGCHQVNLIQIILDPCDTYTVRFCLVQAESKRSRGLPYTELSWQLISQHRDIYCDMLHDLIQQETGLLTRL